MALPIEVFDMHAHLPVRPPGGGLPFGGWGQRYAARFGEEKLRHLAQRQQGDQAWKYRAYNVPPPDPTPLSGPEAAARYAEEVEDHGLLGLTFMTGGGNDALARAIAPYPKLHGFAHHSPFSPGAADELRRAVRELGLVGYKVIAPSLPGRIDSPELDPVWAACEELSVPVLIHFGPLGGVGGITAGENLDPLVLHDVAKGFPDVPFIVPHFGTGYVRELLHLMWACDNVHVDTCGTNRWRMWMWPKASLAELFALFHSTVGASRILFGTDSSYFPRGWVQAYLEEQFRAALEAGIPEGDLEMIFSGNALRLLKLPSAGG